eukprot:CAMPEP_0177642528 /NCGR_PEP_ID=MMETSP0447-20121125/7634_1 /TAXON_ID=0 /ORGANISM="Stygamoeba regulata, Strain BSH-02190019" /LENGTH=397 /DNA_ID=CAMNT_0019144691 /DNA_START=131 /DNA_END=1321 /DNA_ORIENTATION=-
MSKLPFLRRTKSKGQLVKHKLDPKTHVVKKTMPVGGFPPHIEALLNSIRHTAAIREEGIFRITGNRADVEKLGEELGKHGVSIDLKGYDSHVVASVIKNYIRELPEPIFPTTVYSWCLAIADIGNDSEKQLAYVKKILVMLPPENRKLLHQLCEFLHGVSAFQDVNKMNADNLAIVFTPNLLRGEEHMSVLKMMEDSPTLQSVVSIMIEKCAEVFMDTEMRQMGKWTTTVNPKSALSDGDCEEIDQYRPDLPVSPPSETVAKETPEARRARVRSFRKSVQGICTQPLRPAKPPPPSPAHSLSLSTIAPPRARSPPRESSPSQRSTRNTGDARYARVVPLSSSGSHVLQRALSPAAREGARALSPTGREGVFFSTPDSASPPASPKPALPPSPRPLPM